MANKYGAVKKTVDGIKFDSTMEADYYSYLTRELGLTLDKDFTMQDTFWILDNYIDCNGNKVRGIKYKADFCIRDEDGDVCEVIDIKGFTTADFKLKKKHFDFKFKDSGLYIKLITKAPQYHTRETGQKWMTLKELEDLRKTRRK